MGACKPVNTPMSTSEKLSTFEGTPLGPHDYTQYRSIVGGLTVFDTHSTGHLIRHQQGMPIFTCTNHYTLVSSKKEYVVLKILHSSWPKNS
jgi:hypothetical protein